MSSVPLASTLDEAVRANTAYRRVLYTEDGDFQLVAMSVPHYLPLEKHPDNTQAFVIKSGSGRVIVGGREDIVSEGSTWVVPRNVDHTLLVDEGEPIKLLTTYWPPHHAPDRVDLEMPESG